MISDHRLLIISNNVLSRTRSNGKVILSYFDCIPCEMVKQLYFSSESPSVPGYEYFQLSDNDILRGIIHREKRGRILTNDNCEGTNTYSQMPSRIRTPFFRVLRELLWWGKWKSKSLVRWLDEFQPTDIFFVGGDSIFAYSICRFIRNRFNARLSVYLTDDYILPRKKEGVITGIRRKRIKSVMGKCIVESDQFFTISRPMQKTYKDIFGVDSCIVTNMTESLKDATIEENNDRIVCMYAGSLYFGRVDVLNHLAQVIKDFNKSSEKKALLKVFTNLEPDKRELEKIAIQGASEYCGRLSKEELKKEMNRSNIMCIVESFDDKQIENTRLSLSTKVTECLSIGKPILAIGPREIGIIDYLSDVAVCVNREEDLEEKVRKLLESPEMQIKYSRLAYDKFNKNHIKENTQLPFLSKVFGDDILTTGDNLS